MSDCSLTIDRIYGTSSSSPLDFEVSENLVAYIASGGVVVAKIDKSEGTVVSHEQRFFCAKSSESNSSASTHSSANAYLNMAISQNSINVSNSGAQQPDTEKDSYGIVSPAQTICQESDSGSSLSSSISQLKDLSLNQSSAVNSPLSSPLNKSYSRIKTISCVAISPDERFLAVGETGNNPRILLFSLAPDSSSYPILSVSEHSFGVFALKFSPDSTHLLSIGLNHDSFIYLWRVAYNGSSLTITGVNKCTSHIKGVIWVDEHIVTFGTRHIKLWKYESDRESKEMLNGKSVILGQFLNSNFVYATEIGNEEEITGMLFLTSFGDLCLYDFETNSLELKYRFRYSHEHVGVIVNDEFNRDKIWVGEDNKNLIELSISRDFDTDNHLESSSEKCPDSPSKVKFNPLFTAIYQIDKRYLIYLTSKEQIMIYDTESSISKPLTDTLSKDINGVKKCSNGEIINWTTTGIVKRMAGEDNLNLEVVADLDCTTGITALDAMPNGDIITGDMYGTLNIYKCGSAEVVYTTVAHEFSINDVCYFTIGKFEFIITIGRDRMIQVFGKLQFGESLEEDNSSNELSSAWTILQTLAEHKGNLLSLIYNNSKIYVSSADRTISVHKFEVDGDLVSILKESTISLKSSPVSMTIFKDDLVVSTNDKTTTIYNINTFESLRNLKFYDSNNELLLVDNLKVSSKNILICTCSDKSIRVFNYITGKQLSVNWGHSEPINSLLLISSDNLLTLSSSGCLFSWKLGKTFNPLNESSSIQRINDFQTPPKVTRKIKKPASISKPSTPALNSPTRTPFLSRNSTSTRLQSTPKLTPTTSSTVVPTKLSTTSKTSLSPQLRSPSPQLKSPKSPTLASRSPPRASLSPSLSPSRASPSIARTSRTPLVSKKTSKSDIDELINSLISFKSNMMSYSLQDVQRVKDEVDGIFEIEQSLIEKYTSRLAESLKMNKDA